MMSEHLAGMNEKLSTQTDEISALKYQLQTKVGGGTWLHMIRNSMLCSVYYSVQGSKYVVAISSNATEKFTFDTH
jgi:hypothetical protein